MTTSATAGQSDTERLRKEKNSQFTILLVEDDPALRTVLKSVLEIQGFNTRETDSKVGALKILNDDDIQIHVMILDLGLPPKAHNTEEGLDVIRLGKLPLQIVSICV